MTSDRCSILSAFLLAVSLVTSRAGNHYTECTSAAGSTAHNFTFLDTHGRTLRRVDDVIGAKLGLVVNVASFCRLTRQYWELNQMLEALSQDLAVLAFPCNQFGHQEPGVNGTEVMNTLTHVRPGHGFVPHPSLFIANRVDVNGRHELPLFRFLKASCPAPSKTAYNKTESSWDPIKLNDVSWNFEKFIISRQGAPLYRFRPDVRPADLAPIVAILAGGAAAEDQKLEPLLRDLDRKYDS
ncbi:epididymal secretory glutathione peroxidase-like [Physella acuta]|uniref:epididymal secretory glutathione peroxidase-like n=1 Tax=Physella acuta TaxID=109671 RepID=UPI0027DB5296|nr:epididymal secretory glutathione peroxidase-like [Physella acuta]